MHIEIARKQLKARKAVRNGNRIYLIGNKAPTQIHRYKSRRSSYTVKSVARALLEKSYPVMTI